MCLSIKVKRKCNLIVRHPVYKLNPISLTVLFIHVIFQIHIVLSNLFFNIICYNPNHTFTHKRTVFYKKNCRFRYHSTVVLFCSSCYFERSLSLIPRNLTTQYHKGINTICMNHSARGESWEHPLTAKNSCISKKQF